jgi:signal transduction histidine kinase
LLAALGAAASIAALWRGHIEPAESLSRLAADADRRAIRPALLSRSDSLGTVARAVDTALRDRAEFELERARNEERIETTLRQRARQLYDAKDRAEAANRAKSAFLATMSHELRTPLNVIIGFSGMMHQQMLGPIGVAKYVDYVADINRSATHLLSIVNDILDLSRIESNAIDLREENFELAPLVEECAAMLSDRIRAKQIALAVNVAPNVPAIRADRRRIKQILINLLSNAEKFTESGGRIGIHVTRNPEGWIEFVVSDTGIGMTEAEIATALTPFGQVDSRLARKYEGTGLGLPLTKAMAEMHQGRLDIESEPGRGTRVRILLPAMRAVAHLAATHA